MLIEWRASFNTNFPLVDEQHRGLIDLLNKIHDTKTEERSSKFIYDTFFKLVSYTKEHFSTEEKIMKENNYPEFDRHKREHELFVKKISEYLKNCNKDTFDVSTELTDFLKHWFIHHILDNDIAFSKYLGIYKGN